MSQQCEVKRVQQNSAQATVDQATQAYNQAKSDYLSCLGPQEQGSALIEDVRPVMERIIKEVDTITYMEDFILQQMKRELKNDQTVGLLAETAQAEGDKIRHEIETLRTEVRTERRKFLDSNPSATTAVAGLYFTGEPDNQVLIAFVSCFGAFLLFTGLLVLMNHVPLASIQALSSGERIKLVATFWIASLVLAYIGFFSFT